MKQIPESALIPVIQKHQSFIAPNSKLGSVEVESGYGIADVVFYSLDQQSVANRRQKKVSRLKSYEILETLSLLNEFEHQEIAITQLYEKLPYSEQYFRSKLLPFLVKNDLCLVQNDRLDCQWKYKVALQETVAIEAKVSNWRRGLYQAYRYRQYADLSYLALDTNHIQPAWKNINEFQRANVGLIKVDTVADEIEILFFPKVEQDMRNRMLQMYNNEFILQTQNFID